MKFINEIFVDKFSTKLQGFKAVLTSIFSTDENRATDAQVVLNFQQMASKKNPDQSANRSSKLPAPPAHESTLERLCKINARVIRSINLNSAPASSLLVPEYEVLVVGKYNGEIVFVPFTLDLAHSFRTPSVIINRQRVKSPITALTIGKVSPNFPNDMIVSISANGFLQIIQAPSLDGTIAPHVLHTQMIHANIMSAYLHPVEKRQSMELIVVMTDRVVRTFRWDDEQKRFLVVGKWELTGQIMAIAIGDNPLRGTECWAKLHTSRRFVSCRLGANKSVSIHQMATDTPEKLMIMPYRSDHSCKSPRTSTFSPSKELASFATLRLAGVNILASIDRYGLVFIHAYNEKTIKLFVIPPIIQFTSLPECVRLSICHYNGFLVIAVTSHSKKVQIHTISIDFIMDLVGEMEESVPASEMLNARARLTQNSSRFHLQDTKKTGEHQRVNSQVLE
ncbi:unnamed protein product, partial [Mesorhabditis belari]|uniref:Uncharacterized protein n=1 Tax=Mesorhabditis belari TaxID=2138241 RepID=A0AAF3EAR4_9BILA